MLSQVPKEVAMNKLMQKFLFNKSLSSLMLSLIALAALLTGCATPATSVGMTPTSYEIAKKHPNTVSLSIKGGSETSPMYKSQISNEDFSTALIEAIKSSQTFSKVIQGPGGDYVLDITIFNLDQPSFGGSFTVKIEVGWILKRADNNTTVWQESIKSEHTATLSDALAAVKRLRLATEGAAKANIREGLAKISKLNL
jgi:hypothetical protein